MADNVLVNNGDLPDIPTATNEVAGVHYPKTKLVDPRAGQTGAFGVPGNPVSVVHDGTPALPSGAATEATLGSRATEATLAAVLTALGDLLTELNQKTEPANTQQVTGTVVLDGPQLSTVTDVSVVSTAGGTTIRAANIARRGFILHNRGSAIVYVLYSSGTPTTTFFSDLIRPSETLYSGAGCYEGEIKGIAASGTQNILVTEFTVS